MAEDYDNESMNIPATTGCVNDVVISCFHFVTMPTEKEYICYHEEVDIKYMCLTDEAQQVIREQN